MTNINFDVGPNLYHFGLAFLFLHYLLPVVVGTVLILGLYLLARKALTGASDLNRNHLYILIAVAGILLVVMLR